ncbi:MAG TPA: hypothetical protein ENN33_02555 [Ignavibacteria bacterium]|nr:hypothetical protein [Ignavibacteria bacterium]
MKYEDRIVAFIDILGFKSHLDKTTFKKNNQLIDNEQKIAELNEALLLARKVLDIDRPESEKITKEKIVTQFSDSIVISFPLNIQSEVFFTLLQIQWLLMNFLQFDIICRGAISFGKLVHNDKIIFGPALVDAYEAETKAAIYPRIILHESIIEIGSIFHADHHQPEHEKEEIEKIVSLDSDGMYYIDYFSKCQSEYDEPEYGFIEHINHLKRIIRKGLNGSQYDLLVKYGWLKNKYNQMIREHKTKDAFKYYKSFDYALYKFYSNLRKL